MDRTLAPHLEHSLLSRWEPMYRSRLHYLVTWSTRGRKPVLRDRHAAALEALIQRTCEERGYALIDMAAGSDHVHVLVGLRQIGELAPREAPAVTRLAQGPLDEVSGTVSDPLAPDRHDVGA